MTDGPFKHTDLRPAWKDYGKLIDNSNFSLDDCVEQANKALSEELVAPEFKSVVKEIYKALEGGHLFPTEIAKEIIAKASANEQLQALSEEIEFNFRYMSSLVEALDQALLDTLRTGIDQANERLTVHCIEVDEKRGSKGKTSELRSSHKEVFAKVTPNYFKDSIFGKVAAQTTTTTVPRKQDGPPL